jgi:hypothetical protein
MIAAVPFRADHLRRLDFQPAQRWFKDYAFVSGLVSLEGPFSWTCLDQDGPICCGGAREYWPGRANIWAFLSSRVTARNMLKVQRVALRAIDALPFRRCEAAVEMGFEAGHRLVKSLGFEVETPLARKFLPSGADCTLYVRLKG